MSIFPEIIRVLILDKDSKNPISNIATSIKLFASHKNNYNFVLPLSDERGIVEVTKDWLEEEIEREQSLFIMDYSSMLEDCKLQIEISVLSEEALSRAVNAMYLYQDVTGISDEEIDKFRMADNSKVFPCVESIKLESTKILDIEIVLKSKK